MFENRKTFKFYYKWLIINKVSTCVSIYNPTKTII